jgi:hypothetical protein
MLEQSLRMQQQLSKFVIIIIIIIIIITTTGNWICFQKTEDYEWLTSWLFKLLSENVTGCKLPS